MDAKKRLSAYRFYQSVCRSDALENVLYSLGIMSLSLRDDGDGDGDDNEAFAHPKK